jgi:hypothetical protein
MKTMKLAKIIREHPYNCASRGTYPTFAKKALRDVWISKFPLYSSVVVALGEKVTRVMTPVRYSSKPLRLVMMDAVTGSLYAIKSGHCLASDQLKMESAVEQHKACAKRLRALKEDME